MLVGGLHTRLDAFASSWLLREGAASWPRCRGKAPSARCMLHVAARLMTCVPALPGCTASPSAQRSQHSFAAPPRLQRPRLAQYEELTAFHSEEFIDMLRDATPEKQVRTGSSLVPQGFVLRVAVRLLVGVARRWDGA